MKRRNVSSPRADWRERVEEKGLIWHENYWCEDAYYSFTPSQIDTLETASNTLQELFHEAAEDIIARDLMGQFGLPDWAQDLIRLAWEHEPPALNYGRFDLAWNGEGAPKLLEYNADTPTSLLEASITQWDWLTHHFPGKDQFNSLHERLVDAWRELLPRLPKAVHFAHARDISGEDIVTVSYLRDTAEEAGVSTAGIFMEDIGWNGQDFTDLDEAPLKAIFKLYPWEWLIAEEFGPHIHDAADRTFWIEPAWKALWSHKRILSYLWWRFPDHPNLLPAFDDANGMTSFARKPWTAREGANIQLIRNGEEIARQGGTYDEDKAVYQALYDLPEFNGVYPVIGAWIVGGEAAGMGIREAGLITGDDARFVPHIISND